MLADPDAGRHFYNASALACLRSGHINEFKKMVLIETVGGDCTMRFIQCTAKTHGMFKMSTTINGNIIQHPCDIWTVLKRIKDLPEDDFCKLLSLRREYMKNEGQEKEEHMRRTGAVMLTMHLLKTGKINKERKQIRDAIDFFTRHKKAEGNISHTFYVKAA
jgi:hypothetical protein